MTKRTLRLMVAFAVVSVWTLGVLSASADVERHCVVEVVDQKPDGEFITSGPDCFASFSEAVGFASGGAVLLPSLATGAAILERGGVESFSGTFALGVHFDGYNGTGSSITVMGTGCNGGWWNASSTWNNRISSSYNGCYRLTHYDGANKTGASQTTVGVGDTDNLSLLDNQVGSVQYRS